MKVKKYLAVASAISMLAAAIPFSVNAEETVAAPEYRVVEGNAIITNVETDKTKYEIPSTIVDGEKTYNVIGVDDFAFALCKNLEVVVVPDSLTIENTGNVAFLTSSAVMNFMDKELADTASADDIIKYIAAKANYKNGEELTDDDIAEAAVKLNQKLNMVDISVASTVEGKVMTLLKNVDQMNLSDDLQNSFNVWVATITYNGLTLSGSENSPMKDYAAGRKMLNMNYEIANSLIKGDANGDGKFNVRDAAFVASNIAKGIKLEVSVATDYNGDGVVNVRDAAAMARALATGK